MGWQNKVKVLGLILMLLASVTPGVLIPAKAQSANYTVSLLDPINGILLANVTYPVVLAVNENGTAVKDGTNVTLAWDPNNKDILAQTTTISGMATLSVHPTKTGTLYVFVNGVYTGVTLKVFPKNSLKVTVAPNKVFQGQVVTITVNVTVNGTPIMGANVYISSEHLKQLTENGTLQPLVYTASTNGSGIAKATIWVPYEEPLTVKVKVLGVEVHKEIPVLPAPPGRRVQIYGWARKFVEYYAANGTPYYEGTLERVPGAWIFAQVEVNGKPIADAPLIFVGTSSTNASPDYTTLPGEYTFNFTVMNESANYSVFIVAYKPEAPKIKVIENGTYVKILEKQEFVNPVELPMKVHSYLPGYVKIRPGTTSVQANAPAIIETVREINVTLPHVKVDKISYISPCDGQPVQQNAAHDLNDTPMLPAAHGKWFNIEVTITDDQGNPYNFTEAEKEGLKFETKYITATIDKPNIGILDNGTANSSTIEVPIDPETGTAKFRVWSNVSAGDVAKHINIGLADVSNVFNVSVNLSSSVEPKPAKTKEYWHINAPNDAIVIIHNYATNATKKKSLYVWNGKITPGLRLEQVKYSISNYTLLKFVGIGYVSGDVTDHIGEQVGGATVILQIWDNTTGKWVEAKDICGRPLEVTSFDDGHYAFDDVPTTASDVFRVYATKDGAEGYSWNFTIPIGATATADVKLVGKKPAHFELSDLSVDQKSGEAPLTVTASAVVKNTGEMSGKYRVEFKVDGKTVQWVDVELKGGQSQKVEFQYTFVKPGTYKVTIGDLTPVEVTVTKPTTTTSTAATTSSPTTTKKGSNICGPAAIVGLAIIPLLLRKRK